jgi:hypothetical protein
LLRTCTSALRVPSRSLRSALSAKMSAIVSLDDASSTPSPDLLDPAAVALTSIRNLSPSINSIDWVALEMFLAEKSSLNYKDWTQTSSWASELARILGGGPEASDFQAIFERVLRDGNWFGAATYAEGQTTKNRPWIVLVTGLNGIRKTTTMYQPWFKHVLKEALGEDAFPEDAEKLPSGENSFFRQLDYMIATLANEEFKHLYQLAPSLTTGEYSARKDVIFKRYRTVAEILGVLLLRAAQRNHMNALVETSGRDIASFDYVDILFPDSQSSQQAQQQPHEAANYRKLVLHFTIDDIRHAEASVDIRMAGEMKAGSDVILQASGSSDGIDARSIVAINAGGPYGSEVLPQVQADSDRVWETVVRGDDGRRSDWLKASVLIRGSDNPADWSVSAVLPDGTVSPKSYAFVRSP